MKAAVRDLNLDYLAREAEALATAGEQVLDNVRQKHLTAATRWAALAQSARKMTELRATRLVERSSDHFEGDRT